MTLNTLCPKEDKFLMQLNVEMCEIMRLGIQNKRKCLWPM